MNFKVIQKVTQERSTKYHTKRVTIYSCKYTVATIANVVLKCQCAQKNFDGSFLFLVHVTSEMPSDIQLVLHFLEATEQHIKNHLTWK